MINSLGFTIKQIQEIFRMKERVLSRQTIFNAEDRGDIPKAKRIQRGQTRIRQWEVNQLPEIGNKFGFLANQKIGQHIIADWTQKGGTLKTSTVHTLSRALALNNIRTIVIGLDTQPSITNLLLPIMADNLNDAIEVKKNRLGLYHLLCDGFSLNQVIKKTDLPTLDIIPEGPTLSRLERNIAEEVTRESFFKTKLLPLLNDYDVVIFDNGPVWNQLVANSLAAATTVITPVACNFGTFDILDDHMNTLRTFQAKAGQNWQNLFMIATLLENNNLSKEIHMAYVQTHREILLPRTIRSSVIGQEAAYSRLSVLEYNPTSPLAEDFYEVITEIWKRMNDSMKLVKMKSTPLVPLSKKEVSFTQML